MRKIILAFLSLIIVTTLTAGCAKETMPEVNNENCKTEKIEKIKNKEIREEFAHKCFWRMPPPSDYSNDKGF